MRGHAGQVVDLVLRIMVKRVTWQVCYYRILLLKEEEIRMISVVGKERSWSEMKTGRWSSSCCY